MKDIAIYGVGGFGREVACLIRMINEVQSDNAEKWNLIGFFDDGQPVGIRNEYGEVLGNIGALNCYDKELVVAIAIGAPHALRSIYERIENPKICFPNLMPRVQYFWTGRTSHWAAEISSAADVRSVAMYR